MKDGSGCMQIYKIKQNHTKTHEMVWSVERNGRETWNMSNHMMLCSEAQCAESLGTSQNCSKHGKTESESEKKIFLAQTLTNFWFLWNFFGCYSCFIFECMWMWRSWCDVMFCVSRVFYVLCVCVCFTCVLRVAHVAHVAHFGGLLPGRSFRVAVLQRLFGALPRGRRQRAALPRRYGAEEQHGDPPGHGAAGKLSPDGRQHLGHLQ